jgi:hypothetical protein
MAALGGNCFGIETVERQVSGEFNMQFRVFRRSADIDEINPLPLLMKRREELRRYGKRNHGGTS